MDIDTTKPNAGRIYDYYLGGNHNFEADRIAAEQLLKLIPSTKTGARLNRWFMYDIIQRLAESGLDCFLDLGTGLPTGGYIHDLAPHARVLYSDIDAITVAYGQEIIGDMPNVRYIQANVADIDTILHVATGHFGARPKVAVCFIGMTYFVEPGVLRTILDRIFDWCAPGSQMALSFLAGDVQMWERSQFAAIYRQMKAPVYGLEVADVYRLLDKWRIDEPGLQPLNQWNGVEEWRTEGGPEAQDLDLYGVLVTKV